MAKRDYYDILGVGRDADEKQIKSAYRKLAMANHPDRNPDNEAAAERFRESSEAYEVLKDSQKRAAYDQMGHAAFQQSSGFGGGGGSGGGFPGGGFSDIFEQMFSEFSGGRRSANTASRHGSDLRYDLEITLDEAFRGCSKNIEIALACICDSCSGSGAKAGSQPTRCTTCQGVGKVRAQQGFFTIERTCPNCNGAGEMIANPCSACRGQGRVKKNENLSVNIPAGVNTGNRIRLSGKGNAGLRGAQSGDLYIFISVRDHPLFQRDDNTLYLNVPVPMVTATLGGTINVPTLSGKMTRLVIDAGTQTGRKFRMRGKGMPALRGSGVGDQIVQIEVETPTNLSKKQIDLLTEFDEAGAASPQTEGFVDRVKKLWS